MVSPPKFWNETCFYFFETIKKERNLRSKIIMFKEKIIWKDLVLNSLKNLKIYFMLDLYCFKVFKVVDFLKLDILMTNKKENIAIGF